MIPDFQSCMRPLLASVSDGQIHRFNESFEQVCMHFQLTEDEQAEKLPSGKQTIIRNRIAWARTYLNKAGLLTAPGRSQLQITDRGQAALQQEPERIDVRFLKQFPEFVEFHTAKPKANKTVVVDDNDTEDTDPTERLEEAYSEIRQELIDEVLRAVKQQSPQFLEKLVVELMQAMGYGGWSKESGQATQYTADGGIDGLINEDPLGLDTIYLQAKRYEDSTIGREAIQAFSGALDMQRAHKGVFITTSKFSKGALEYVSMIQKKIILIDGAKLATLMIKHNLGVSVKETYEIKALDTDFFSED
ncbi:Mrr restriction system protein [Teredinibacter turnerae T7901]|uniref:Mrr restriction system protein n=1 Tax=Teredinibacter turnerae (strain ATCC 39867 / T7901) TaxID=377629 RepID=C5BKD0_TERTT|nr:restriction endonuclease [Teredinibacter turnerae]ACR11503.1 Mrr restriction system protein [Teredinibacter turnerae T7901]